MSSLHFLHWFFYLYNILCLKQVKHPVCWFSELGGKVGLVLLSLSRNKIIDRALSWRVLAVTNTQPKGYGLGMADVMYDKTFFYHVLLIRGALSFYSWLIQSFKWLLQEFGMHMLWLEGLV